jgi:hypothetical protein
MNHRLGITALLAAMAGTVPTSASAATNLGGLWHLNESSGAIASDASGNSNDGTITGAARISGRFQRGLHFDGVDDKVVVPRSSSLEPEHVTAEAWLRAPSSPGPYKHIISQGASDCGSASYGLYTGANGGLIFYIAQASPTFTLSPDAGAGVWDGAWHHVAGTFDGATVRLYVDGVEVGSGTPTSLTIGYPFNLPDGFIGGFGTDCVSPITNQNLNYAGDLDEPRIWRRALAATEIAASSAMGGAATTELDHSISSSQAIVYTSDFSSGKNIKVSLESATGTESIAEIRIAQLLPIGTGAGCGGGLLLSPCKISLSNGGRTAQLTVTRQSLGGSVTLKVRLKSGRELYVSVDT